MNSPSAAALLAHPQKLSRSPCSIALQQIRSVRPIASRASRGSIDNGHDSTSHRSLRTAASHSPEGSCRSSSNTENCPTMYCWVTETSKNALHGAYLATPAQATSKVQRVCDGTRRPVGPTNETRWAPSGRFHGASPATQSRHDFQVMGPASCAAGGCRNRSQTARRRRVGAVADLSYAVAAASGGASGEGEGDCSADSASPGRLPSTLERTFSLRTNRSTTPMRTADSSAPNATDHASASCAARCSATAAAWIAADARRRSRRAREAR